MYLDTFEKVSGASRTLWLTILVANLESYFQDVVTNCMCSLVPMLWQNFMPNGQHPPPPFPFPLLMCSANTRVSALLVYLIIMKVAVVWSSFFGIKWIVHRLLTPFATTCNLPYLLLLDCIIFYSFNMEYIQFSIFPRYMGYRMYFCRALNLWTYFSLPSRGHQNQQSLSPWAAG